MPASSLDLNLKRNGGLTHVLDKGLGLRGWADVLEMSGDYIDIVKLGWGTAYVTHEPPAEARPAEGEACRHRRHVLRGRLCEERVRRLQALAHRARPHARRDLRRNDRDAPRAQARADRRLRARLHRALRGRLEGLRSRLRALRVGRMDQGREGRGCVEGDHRGARGRHRRHLSPFRRDAHRPGRRDRALDRLSRPRLGGADQGLAGVVHQALRPVGEPREHPAGRGHRARDAPARPSRRHVEGGAPRRTSHVAAPA